MVSQKALQLPGEDHEPLHHQHPPLAPEARLEAGEEAGEGVEERLWNLIAKSASLALRQKRSAL